MNVGANFYHFILKSTDNKLFNSKLIDKEKKVVVFFTCNHCPYVHAYEERIITLQEKFIDSVQFVGINSNNEITYPEDSFDKMRTRYYEKNYNFPYLLDDTQKTAKAFNATHTPHFFLFNAKRILTYKGKLDDNWDDALNVKKNYLKDAIELNDDSISIIDTLPVGCSIKW